MSKLERLLKVTGGWPLLVESAGQLVVSGVEEEQALGVVDEKLASRVGATAFVDSVGITIDNQLITAFNSVLTLIDHNGARIEDLVAAVALGGDVDDPDLAVAILKTLGAFDVDANGVYRPEPLLTRCWRDRASSAG